MGKQTERLGRQTWSSPRSPLGPSLLRCTQAQDILSALQPTHSDLVIRSSLVELGEEGFQSLLRDLRSRSRSRAGKWADFCLDSVAIFISGSDSTEQSELDRFVGQ